MGEYRGNAEAIRALVGATRMYGDGAKVVYPRRDSYFRERLPWRIATIPRAVGSMAAAHFRGDLADALRRGIEDLFIGDVAHVIKARVTVHPKTAERELGG